MKDLFVGLVLIGFLWIVLHFRLIPTYNPSYITYEICQNGVVYYKTRYSLSPKYLNNGKLESCK